MADTADLKEVQSSNLSHVGYSPDSREMVVRFKSGGTYKYSGVPPEAHSAFMAADSKGGHFAKNISGKYKHEKISQ